MTTVFHNKKVVVAGGTSGIGLAAARLFLKAGALVTVTGRKPGKMDASAAKGLEAVKVDSSDQEALTKFFTAHTGIDHLVISLGGSKGLGNFSELSTEVLRQGFDEKFWPQLNTLKAALPYLNQKATVTFVTAVSGSSRMPGTSGLAAINGALEVMVPILAKELRHLRINAVSPGVVDSPWWDFVSEKVRRDAFAQYATQILVGRVAQPDDIADVIVFMAGNEYMTGKVIVCDGGLA